MSQEDHLIYAYKSSTAEAVQPDICEIDPEAVRVLQMGPIPVVARVEARETPLASKRG